jgi:hypothetical protein
MVRHVRDYRWSSYRANAEDKLDPRVTPHDRYLASDPPRNEWRVRAWQSTFRGSGRTGARSARHPWQAWPPSQASSGGELDDSSQIVVVCPLFSS